MAFLDRLTKAISSDSGLVQADTASQFQLVNPNGPRPVTRTDQLDPWGEQFVQESVQTQLQSLQRAQLQRTSLGSRNQQQVIVQPGANPYGVPREPWVFATFADLTDQTEVANALRTNQGIPNDAIVWYANPKSVDWNISQRGSESKTKSGTVLHVWRDKLRKTDFDDPKITMTFQTGNIMSVRPDGVDPNWSNGIGQMAPGLNDFYKFMSLVDASKIKNGQANLIHILYRSRIFPSMVISGFFDPNSVVKFTDSSDQPFQVTGWSSTFTIYKTIPALNDWKQLAGMFQAEFGLQNTEQRKNNERQF